jgi:RNA polymerase-binding protein DksA
MNKKDKTKLKNELHLDLEELVDQLKGLEEELEDARQSLPSETIDQASYNENILYMSTQIERKQKKLEAIKDVLKRIDTDKFGICKECGKKIKNDRLLTIPTTLYCAKCANSK